MLDGRRVFVHERGDGATTPLLHGFPARPTGSAGPGWPGEHVKGVTAAWTCSSVSESGAGVRQAVVHHAERRHGAAAWRSKVRRATDATGGTRASGSQAGGLGDDEGRAHAGAGMPPSVCARRSEARSPRSPSPSVPARPVRQGAVGHEPVASGAVGPSVSVAMPETFPALVMAPRPVGRPASSASRKSVVTSATVVCQGSSVV